ncbi:MAG: hypothetical protein ACJ8AW_27380 [Rhodopila sp.]
MALALLKRLGADGRCDPSHQTLSADSGESPDTVKKALKALYGLGMDDWLRRLIREGTQVRQTSNSYLLTLGNPAVLPAVRCEVDSARETRKLDLDRKLPKDPLDRRVFDVSTEDRLNALAALQDAGRRRAEALGLRW